MVNIWTYKYYKEHKSLVESRTLNAEKFIRHINFSQFREVENLEQQAMQIMHEVDGVQEVYWDNNAFASPINGEVCPKEWLSAGCKTALVLLWCSYYLANHEKRVAVNLLEAGPNALYYCASILDNAPNLIGVMFQSIIPTFDPNTFFVCVNDNRRFHNWIIVAAACHADNSLEEAI